MAKKALLVLLLLTPLGFYPFLRHTDVPPVELFENLPPPKTELGVEERLAVHCFAVFPGQPFPGNLPWEPLRRLAEDETSTMRRNAAVRLVGSLPDLPFPGGVPWEPLVKLTSDQSYIPYLLHNEPVRFLENCLARYESKVQGYRCTFLKQERVKGNLRKAERIVVHFREKPFSVHMEWKEGMDLAIRSMYVQGENKGMLLARPTIEFLGIWEKPVDGPDAMATSRFPITQFGVYIGAQRTLNSIHDAEKRGALFLRYKGIEAVAKLGNRPCHKFERWKYEPEEEDGLYKMIIYIDQETLFQTGSMLYDKSGELIAEYFFRDMQLNPVFDAKQFTRAKM